MAKGNKKVPIISDTDVVHVAALANLTIEETKIPKFNKDLESILEFVKQVQAAPTQNVEETAQTTGLTNVWRDDVVDDSRMLSQELALSNSKRQHNGYFVVARVLE